MFCCPELTVKESVCQLTDSVQNSSNIRVTAQLKFSWSCTFHPSENADDSQLRTDCSNNVMTDTLTTSAVMMNRVTPDERRRGVARECCVEVRQIQRWSGA